MASLYIPKWQQFSTDAGTPLNGGKLLFSLTTTTTNKDTYPSEADAIAMTNANVNPVVLDTDGRSPVEIWISGRYRLRTYTSADVLISDDDPIEDTASGSSAQSNTGSFGGNNSGTPNALIFTYNPAITTYVNGQQFSGRILTDNTNAVTVDAGAGPLNLVKRDGTALVSGDLQGPDIINFAFDLTSNLFRLTTPDGNLYRDGSNQPARVDVASAATVDLDSLASTFARITGVATITAFTQANGRRTHCVAGGAFSITTSAGLLIEGFASGKTILMVAGETFDVYGEAGGIVRLSGVRYASIGYQVNYAFTGSTSVDTSTTIIPLDDTVPTNSEGEEYTALNTAFTPKHAASLVEISVNLPVVSLSSSDAAFAIFEGTTCIFCSAYDGESGDVGSFSIKAVVAAATTTIRTYSLRYGPQAGSATVYLGSDEGAALYSTVRLASMTVKEIATESVHY